MGAGVARRGMGEGRGAARAEMEVRGTVMAEASRGRRGLGRAPEPQMRRRQTAREGWGPGGVGK